MTDLGTAEPVLSRSTEDNGRIPAATYCVMGVTYDAGCLVPAERGESEDVGASSSIPLRQ
jgi:hypothetical protein